MPKILLFCPLNPEFDHSGNRTVQVFGRTNLAIFNQDYPQYDIWFSKGDNPIYDSNGRGNICHNYQKARRWVLDNDYDYLFTVEADMIPPADALTKLLEVDTDVAYGLYCFKHTSTWSAMLELTMDKASTMRKYPDFAKQMWGKVIDVKGVGLGCTLIKREVLEQIDFRIDELRPRLHNDWVFAWDLQEKGFEQKCHTGVVCGHISLKPSPRIIWPDPNEPRQYRNTFINGIPVRPDGIVDIDITSLGDFYIDKKDLRLIKE